LISNERYERNESNERFLFHLISVIWFLNVIIMATQKSQTKSVTGSKYTTKTVTKAGKADKRTNLGGSKKK